MTLRTSTSTSTTSTTSFFFLCALLRVTLVSSNELRIHNASEFITFSESVNSGTNYTWTTVYLESDLDFSGGLSEQFGVIGVKSTISFCGTFDGQGHTFSNLAIKSSFSYAGLFGHSSGPVKNLVMDSSCSVASNYTGTGNAHVGGIIGYYDPGSDNKAVSNIVNMADVTFEGSATGGAGYLYLGGIVGYIPSSNYEATVRNCANYGSLRHSGVVSESAFIGGIVGQSFGDSSSKRFVQNCLNYGPITATGSGSLYIGGIVGKGQHMNLINCMSAGRITSNAGNKGVFIGYADTNIIITHCLWTSDVGCGGTCGSGSPTITESSLVAINPTTVDDLNKYASNNGWNKWLLNENNKSVTFKINTNENGFVLSSQLILHPGVDVESGSGLEFSEWFSDPYCNEPFTSSQINEDTTLYGLYGKIISITFNPNGGTVSQNAKRVIMSGTYGALPVPTRTNFAFLGWFTEMNGGEKVEANSRVTSSSTLYAQWKANEYTVTFNVNGGDDLEESSKAVTFDAPYGELPEPNRDGYTFLGWFTEMNGGEKVEANSRVTSSSTLYAQWKANEYTVTFNVNGGDDLEEPSKAVTFDAPYGELPEPRKNGYSFLGWFTENNESITSEIIVTSPMNHTLYAQWVANEYTVTFDFANGTKIERVLHFNETIIYPDNLVREGCMFIGWNPRPDVMPANNLTINAQWKANNYTVTFNVNGGDDLKEPSKAVTFNSTYGTLPTPTRANFKFLGWFNENNESVTSETTVTSPRNHTLIAQWEEVSLLHSGSSSSKTSSSSLSQVKFSTGEVSSSSSSHGEVPSSQVEIVFGTKDMTEEKAKEIIRQYTDNNDFKIVKFEVTGSDETRVIIKFNDIQEAENFVDDIRGSRALGVMIKAVSFNYEKLDSFSPILRPILFLI